MLGSGRSDGRAIADSLDSRLARTSNEWIRHTKALPACARRRPLTYFIPAAAAVLVLLTFLFPTRGWAAAYGSVSGIIRDESERPVAGAKLLLESAAHEITERQTDSTGGFDFPKVAIGHYMLSISRHDFTSLSVPVTVEAGYFPFANIVLKLPSELAEVVVTASGLPVVASVTPITMVSQEEIENTPGASDINSLAMITDYVPGAYQAHDMLHMRGGHQTNWLIDGVEIPNTNIAENLGPELNPQDVETLGIERGSYRADEGDRTYGIFNVIPKSGFSSNNQAQLDLTAGDFGQTDDYLSVASHTSDFAYYASLEGNHSNLGLQTPQSEIIHDQTHGYGGFTNLQYNRNEQDSVSFIAQLRQDDYQIPDCIAPLADDPYCIGQSGDVQSEADDFALLSWAHAFTNNAVLTSSLLYRFDRANYDGAAGDYPTITTYHHSSQYEGAEESLRMSFSRNHLDVGLFGFAQQDQADFKLGFTDGSSPPLNELESPTGQLITAWVQDTFEATRWLNLSAGVRQSHFQGSVTENVTDPRLGATVLLPRLDWVLSAFWGKYYQAPPLETLSGPLVAYATTSDTAFLPLRGERDTERQFGITIPVKGWSIEADHFVNQASNFFDHNPLGESDIFLPITDQGARIEGTELTVRSPPFWRYGQVHLAYSNQTADCFGSITGGLVVAGTACGFPPVALDHDQRNTLNLGYNTKLPAKFFVGTNLSFNSGLSNGFGGASHLSSYAVLDLTVGRNITPQLSMSITALNVTNAHLLTDNSLTFGGVHWNNPFQIYAQLRYKFHY
jgi:TonB dependent receptor/Carboxypeptidase regulatory-like domain/TonB-dependent Receptor Plug Domain